MKIPLSKMYVDDDMRKTLVQTLDSCRYIKGEQLSSFEKEFASFCGVRHGVAVSSGTAAITVALMALGVREGDEVIVPSHSFIATATPTLFLGAKPVFAEIDPKTYCISAADAAKKITDKTKAIIPVHLYGHPADMDPLLELAQEKDLFVVEDACQAHGAEYKGKRVGGIGDIACFSFFPSKNMTVCGDGGMITTSNDELAERASMLRDHGRKGKYLHEMLGFNFRLSEIHAALGREQLKHLSEWTEKRRRNAKAYGELLGGKAPFEAEWAKHVYHMYVVRVENRDSVLEKLKAEGIDAGVHYPVPIHLQPCITEMLGKASLPETEKAANEVLSLPMHPQLTTEEICFVAEKLNGLIK